jgi:hypothetical protein
MRKCVICEGLLNEKFFTGGSFVCDTCAHRLQSREEIKYSEQDRHTVFQAYVNLLLAIREQAIDDGKYEDWEAYWLDTNPWPFIWKEIYGNYKRDIRDFRNSIR